MSNANQVTLVNVTIPAAGTYTTPGYYVGRLPAGAKYVAAQANFVRSAGGTTADVFIQTSLDDEATWCDVANFSFTTSTIRKVSAVKTSTALAANTTPTDGAITANTILSGLIGTKFRVKYVVVGSYTGTLRVDLVLR
jgi:hypothetical protein